MNSHCCLPAGTDASWFTVLQNPLVAPLPVQMMVAAIAVPTSNNSTTTTVTSPAPPLVMRSRKRCMTALPLPPRGRLRPIGVAPARRYQPDRAMHPTRIAPRDRPRHRPRRRDRFDRFCPFCTREQRYHEHAGCSSKPFTQRRGAGAHRSPPPPCTPPEAGGCALSGTGHGRQTGRLTCVTSGGAPHATA